MTVEGILAALTVLLPFLAVPGILGLRRRPNLREGASVAAAVGTFALVAAQLPRAFSGTPATVELLTFAPGLSLGLHADLLGLLFALLSSFLWIPTTVYSIGYMRGLGEHSQARYYACFAAVIGSTMGVALSSNLFSLLVFYEVLTVSTYPLVIHHETEEAYRAGRKYLMYTLGGGGAVFAGLAITAGTQVAAGLPVDLSFLGGGNPSLPALPRGALQAVAALLVTGFGVKSTLMPLHGWLPSAMIAPTPVSGLLHAVAVVKAGVFGELRTLLFFLGPGLVASLGVQPVLLAVSAVTIVAASLLALAQDNLKLRLAYSTISQLSYVVLGAALLSADGVVGSAAHIAAHGFAKLTMFFVAGIILVETGKTRVSELSGIGRTMPGAMAAFTISAAAMAGVPPLAPFLSKGYITAGVWEAGDWVLVAVLWSSALLNVAYFFPIVARAFFGAAPAERRERATMLGPILATAAGTVLLGVWAGLPFGPFAAAEALAPRVLPSGEAPAFDPLAPDVLAEVAVVALAAAGVLAVLRRRLSVSGGVEGSRSGPERAVLAGCAALGRGFERVYGGFVAGVAGLGRASRRLQTGDLNWNVVGLFLGLAAVLLWLLREVLLP